MSINAQSGVFSFAPQTAKVGDGTFTVPGKNWYRFRTPSVSGGGTQMQQMMPLEMGGPLVPSGVYKSGAAYASEVELVPRLENTLGYLLYAALGNVTSITGVQWTASGAVAATAVNAHIFRFNPSDHSDLPWLATRYMLPGATAADRFGEVAYDAKVSGLQLNIPSMSIITARVGFQGRCFFFPNYTDVQSWTYANALEDADTIAVTGKGKMLFGTDAPKLTNMTVTLSNNLTSPQQEGIIGSYYADDITTLTRSINIRASVKWQNPQLWKQLMTGSTSGVNWSALPFVSESAGNVKALEAVFEAPIDIPGSSSKPYTLRIMASRAVMSLDRGTIQLRAGDLVQFNVNIDILEPLTGQDYVQIVLENAVTSYTWS
jgi:hypothetical protein